MLERLSIILGKIGETVEVEVTARAGGKLKQVNAAPYERFSFSRQWLRDIMVSMTSSPKTPNSSKATRRTMRSPVAGQWRLQEAKARFSELVRRVRSDGPQHVTVHGQDAVVVLSAEEYARLQGEQTGAALIAAMAASPHRDIDLTSPSVRAPVPAFEL